MSNRNETYRVMVNLQAQTGPIKDFAEAHNIASSLTINEPLEEGLIYEVVESYEWMCMKCGDDYFTTIEADRPTGRWRCNACVWGWL